MNMINDRYVIKDKLGSGRSAVYLCLDKNLQNKQLAIKILPKLAGDEEVRSFKEEFFVLQKLNHPNIVKSYDLGTVITSDENSGDIETGCKYFTMELCEGNRLTDFSEIEEKELLKIIAQLCSVLYYLHQSNYIYYDLKSENILLSVKSGKPSIKLIDLGLARHTSLDKNEVKRGTPEYIAPEILKNLSHDYRVDFYSLGILLYQIIYHRLPFVAANELEIFKAHIEKEFEFPGCGYSKSLVDVIKKMLCKSPSGRYNNSIQILNDLNIPLSEDIYKDWLPARTFADRRDFINILRTYINDNSSNEVFALHGAEGAGKTALVYQIYSMFDDVVLITNTNSITGVDFIKAILKSIIYNEMVFAKLPPGMFNELNNLLNKDSSDFNNEIKGAISRIAALSRFTIILDAFNLYDELTGEILAGIIPIFQINKIKVIITENSDKQLKSGFINNLRVLDLTPFIESNLNEYLALGFSSFFPKDELKRLILAYADLLPGSLESFIKDLIILKILQFTPSGVTINFDNYPEKFLRSSHEEIYSMRLKKLNTVELELVQLLSSFEITLADKIAAELSNVSLEELDGFYTDLAQKNILHKRRNKENPVFTSEGLKRHIYSYREDNVKYHEKIACRLKEKFPDFNPNELARQFELAQKYEDSYEILKKEIQTAEKQSAFSYAKNMLLHLLNLQLSPASEQDVKYNLVHVYYKLGAYLQMNSLLDELLSHRLVKRIKTELLILKGYCLIGMGENVEGKKMLENALNDIADDRTRFQVLIKIATAEYNLNEYGKSSKICMEITNDNNCTNEEKANALEILGLVHIQSGFRLDDALKCFEKAELFFDLDDKIGNVAEMQMNIANIYLYKGDFTTAEIFWKKSLVNHLKTGNIEHYAKVLGNFGLLHYKKLNLELSIEYYHDALKKLETIGDNKSRGVILGTLGEIYILIGKYDKAYNYLIEAKGIFKVQHNISKELDANFNIGKLFLIIGNYSELLEIIKEYELRKKDYNLSEEYALMYNLMSYLLKIKKNGSELNLDILKKNLTDLFAYNRVSDFLLLHSYIIISLFQNSLYDSIYELLLNDEYNELCEKNLYASAEKNFFLGLLSYENASTYNLISPIEYFEIAYKILRDLDISEITWKVLAQLSRFYANRGQISKAKEYANDALSLINFFAGNITDSRLKQVYLNESTRKDALEMLNKILSNI